MEIISPEYHPAQAATYGGSDIRPLLNTPTYEVREHWAATVQPFRAGGYEVTLKSHDLQKAADRALIPRRYGKREDTGERSQDSLDVSRQRAKAMVRKRIKDMGANRLCTLTIRQNDSIGHKPPEWWADSFARYARLSRKHGMLVDYVSVLEPHKKGLERLRNRPQQSEDVPEAAWDIPLHIHFVTRHDLKMPINTMRKLWEIASGAARGDCNVDVQFLGRTDCDATIDKVAKYASKYITKGLAEFERFNKKRYWAAGKPLLAKGRYWMRGRTLSEVFDEMRKRLGITDSQLGAMIQGRKIFFFPAEQGVWLNVRPSPHASPPPF